MGSNSRKKREAEKARSRAGAKAKDTKRETEDATAPKNAKGIANQNPNSQPSNTEPPKNKWRKPIVVLTAVAIGVSAWQGIIAYWQAKSGDEVAAKIGNQVDRLIENAEKIAK